MREARIGTGTLTFATPKFSIDGILCPACLEDDINGAHFSKCSICSFQHVRTSEIKFTLFEWIEVGMGGLNKLGR